jgi:hypothetical protein
VPRRRQTPPRMGLRAGTLIALALVLASNATVRTAWSQPAPAADFPLLEPSLDGNPPQPPVFRKPLDAPDTTELPPGQPPNFSDQPGFGAGTTGFQSTTTRKKRTNGQASDIGATAQSDAAPAASPATVLQPMPPPPAPDAVSAARLLQNQNRTRHGTPGADANANTATAPLQPAPALTSLPPLDAPDPALSLPRSLIRKPVVDEAPFDPVGIQAGTFLLRPAIEFTGGYDTNPARTQGGSGSMFGIVAPELQASSNWERHELTANLRGSYTDYGSQPTYDRPSFDGKIDGRIDVSRLTRIDLEARTLVSTDNPGSPNIQAGIAKLPIYTDVGSTIGVGQRFNRIDVEAKGLFDRTTYQPSTLTDGTTSSNDDRNFDQYGTQLRAGYDLMPGVAPFAEVDLDERIHDLAFDRSGLERDSDGRAGKLGSTFSLSPIVTGQFALGYMSRSYRDATLPDLQGATFDSSLAWLASALTTVKLTTSTTANETTVAGVAGIFTHEVGIEVDHAFRRWLDVAFKLTLDRDNYVASPREDNRFSAGTVLTYKLTREMWLRGEVRRDWLASNIPGNDYAAYVAMLTLRLQR